MEGHDLNVPFWCGKAPNVKWKEIYDRARLADEVRARRGLARYYLSFLDWYIWIMWSQWVEPCGRNGYERWSVLASWTTLRCWSFHTDRLLPRLIVHYRWMAMIIMYMASQRWNFQRQETSGEEDLETRDWTRGGPVIPGFRCAGVFSWKLGTRGTLDTRILYF